MPTQIDLYADKYPALAMTPIVSVRVNFIWFRAYSTRMSDPFFPHWALLPLSCFAGEEGRCVRGWLA